MDTNKVTIEMERGKVKETRTVDLARFCLALAGGGLNFNQTAKAMEYQQRLSAGETIKVNLTKISVIGV